MQKPDGLQDVWGYISEHIATNRVLLQRNKKDHVISGQLRLFEDKICTQSHHRRSASRRHYAADRWIRLSSASVLQIRSGPGAQRHSNHSAHTTPHDPLQLFTLFTFSTLALHHAHHGCRVSCDKIQTKKRLSFAYAKYQRDRQFPLPNEGLGIL